MAGDNHGAETTQEQEAAREHALRAGRRGSLHPGARMGRGLQDPRLAPGRRHAGDQLLRAAHLRHRRAHRAGLRDRPDGLLVRERTLLRLDKAAGEEGLHRQHHREPGPDELQLLVQRVLELHRGEGLREPVRHDEREPDVHELREPGDDLRHELQQLGALGLAHVQQLQPPGWRHGRLRALNDERGFRVQARRGRRSDRPQRRPAHLVLGALLCGRRGRAHGHLDTRRHARVRRVRADLLHRQVRGTGLHALGRRHRPDAPPASYERDLRDQHGGLLVFELQLPVLQLHEPCERGRPGQPLGRALDALHVQLLCVHDDRLPGLRSVHADGPVLHVLGVQQANEDLRGRDLGAAFERNLGLAVLLLVLHIARRRQRHRVGQQQDGVHLLPHRHREHSGVHYDRLAV